MSGMFWNGISNQDVLHQAHFINFSNLNATHPDMYVMAFDINDPTY